jgi:hypothetical protein
MDPDARNRLPRALVTWSNDGFFHRLTKCEITEVAF